MPIGFQAPLPPTDGWVGHKKEVKRVRGAACYAALAAHFGTDSPKELEWRVDGRRPYGRDGDPSISNKYRRWRQGRALPSDETAARVIERSGGSVRLGFWRDLPLWELLAPEPPPMQRIHRLLETSPKPIRRILFFNSVPDIMGRFCHTLPERDQTLAIRNQYSLDALIVLLCLARKGEMLEDDPQHHLPSACAFDILPRVLYTHWPLRYRWEHLFACLDRIYWQRVYLDGSCYMYPIKKMRAHLMMLDADPAAKLPQKSGKRLRVICDDPLRLAEERILRAISVT
ncbi:hypothetical protein [Metallibacterium scheffleri]|uniref:hypothetical protein n=1 Tax=Metallibacterium scheffleri TaxID=993689 RepID=UPI0010A03274|nr:hypothetical protein [Metallibacterium scheffleri]